MACRLDISPPQMSAMSDYVTRHAARFSTDFLRKDMSGCLLCGDVQGGTAGVLRHTNTQIHRKNVNEYNIAMQLLINMELR